MTDFYSVILPTYNEKDNLPLIICMINRAFESINKQFEIVVVEDNSPDGTLEVAKELQKIFGQSKILIHSRPGKMGLGSAYVDGLKLCKGNFVFLMDADMSHHPKHIPEFIQLQKKSNCDIVLSTRYAQGGGVAGWDLKRVLMSRGANLLANLLLNTGISDLTGSFRLYKREVFDDLIRSIKGKTYVFQMEIILRATVKGYVIKESPIMFVDRIYGASKLGAMEVVSYLKGVWDLFLDI